jgi:hypothetical protein
MTEGRHYWETELTDASGHCVFMLGAARPSLDHDKGHQYSSDAFYIYAGSGGLYGNDGKSKKSNAHRQGKFVPGDRVGVLLDLDAGWLRFYRNGQRCGPGFTEGVTGPLVRAAELRASHGHSSCSSSEDHRRAVAALPGAVAPEGAGAVHEPFEDGDG